MNLIVVGTNHKYSPVELREKLSFSKKRLKDALFLLKESRTLSGGVILSTCNRVEIYASASYADSGIEELKSFISGYHEIAGQILSPYLYIYRDRSALAHLMSVASGIDSLVLGETQILGQVESAFLESEREGFLDKPLKETFSSAMSFAKKAHEATGISGGKTSVGSVAIDFIKERVGTLSNKNVLIIGVGKVTELVLKHLKTEGVKVTFVSNRTFDKAKELAHRINAKAVRFDELNKHLKMADIVITATASRHPIIRKETVARPVKRKLLIIDLALPRDVDPAVREIENVDLFGLEDLDTVIKKNIEKKSHKRDRIREIIDIEREILWQRLTRSAQEPALLP
jgi:glutamyl-tRNA reductase